MNAFFNSVSRNIYPEYEWKPYLFLSISRKVSKDPNVLESFMEYAKVRFVIFFFVMPEFSCPRKIASFNASSSFFFFVFIQKTS